MTDNDTHDVHARTALDQWLVMWNSDGEVARQLCADDFRIRFDVTEPDGSSPADDIQLTMDEQSPERTAWAAVDAGPEPIGQFELTMHDSHATWDGFCSTPPCEAAAWATT